MSCQAELGGLGQIHAALNDLGISVAAVCVDPPATSERVVRRLDLPFDILADEDLTVIKSLGLLHEDGKPGGGDIAIPALLLVDTDRTVLWHRLARRIQDRLQPEEVLRRVRGTVKDG